MRINQFLANKNLASRREADELIQKGLVFVNGKVAVLGQKVDEMKDKVEIKGLKKDLVYYTYNKPIGIVTTTPQNGEVDIIHHTRFPAHVFPVGRLDKDSHGLIIMTNDRTLTKKILDPKTNHEKEYIVEIAEKVTEPFLKFLAGGVEIEEGVVTKPCIVKKISANSFSIILTEGKNRQIRRMVSAYDFTVKDLKRVRIGKVLLRDLKPGAFSAINPKLLS
jgi:23S rRNA pseudouridine2604 synthase